MIVLRPSDRTAVAEPQVGRKTAQRHRRCALVMLLLLAVLLIACVASLIIGALPTSPAEVVAALQAPQDQLQSTTSASQRFAEVRSIVIEQRLPRTLAAAAVGCALGVAGALTQAHTKNPLADPGLLGISSAAALAVVIATVVFRVSDPHAYVVAAVLGAACGSLAVMGLARLVGGDVSPLALILSGAALSGLFSAIVTVIVLVDRASLAQLRTWSVGNVAVHNLAVTAVAAPMLLLAALWGYSTSHTLNVLALGAPVAANLGVATARARTIGMVVITLLAGGATAIAGPIGFLGLTVPHAARAIAGSDYRWIIPLSGVFGAIALLCADIIGRLVLRPAELQVGVVLGLLGAPLFILLVRRRTLQL